MFDDPVLRRYSSAVWRTASIATHSPNPVYFTDAYFHRPGELSRELLAAGFRVLEVVARSKVGMACLEILNGSGMIPNSASVS